MGLERDWLNLARTILRHQGVSQRSKKDRQKYQRSNKERQVCCSVTKLRTKENTQKSILHLKRIFLYSRHFLCS